MARANIKENLDFDNRNKLVIFSSFSSVFKRKQYFLCVSQYRVIDIPAKVWKNSKNLWKHSPAARLVF